jgi:DNA-binding LytR/AlgR family response regulator
MKLSCVIIDDEPLAIDVISGHISQTPCLTLAQKFTNPVKAFEYLSENRVDILFVDIQMSDLSGIELVQNLEFKPLIIFTTAFDKYAMDGFKVDAIDYLLKPVDYPEFLKATEKAKQWIIAKNRILDLKTDKEFLFIKSEYKTIRIDLNSIKYIEGMSEYVRIHREQNKSVMSLLSLKSLEEHLPEDQFMRVHKSFIINLKKISEIENNYIVCSDGKTIPVSKLYKDKFQEYVNNNFMF